MEIRTMFHGNHPRCPRFAGSAFVVLTLFTAAPPLSATAAPLLQLVNTLDGPGGIFDLTSDGRVVAIVGDDVYLEQNVGTGVYDLVGSLPEGTISTWGASFLSVSPDGSRAAIGDNNFGAGNVHVFNLDALNGGTITTSSFAQENFEAAWVDNRYLAVSYANTSTYLGEVSVLDLDTGTSTAILTLGGASAGISFDSFGNLYTGNGYDYFPGGSETGEIRAFSSDLWQSVLNGDREWINFESEGQVIGDFLTAASLRFDADGNLFVGGGDLYGGSGDYEYFGLIGSDAVLDAFAGGPPADLSDLFVDDPENADWSLYSARFDINTNEWIIGGTGNGVLYRYRVIPLPPAAAVMVIGSAGFLLRRRRRNHV